ncbi:MAG: IPT/TIG domain-containing protein [Acidobacteriota bacterium]
MNNQDLRWLDGAGRITRAAVWVVCSLWGFLSIGLQAEAREVRPFSAGRQELVFDRSGVRAASGNQLLGARNPSIPLAVPGELALNTFLGSVKYEDAFSVAIDASGNVYVTGQSSASWGSPVRPFTGGVSDAFVAKLNPQGELVWNTFLGGSISDAGTGIVVDAGGNTFVTGHSTSSWGTPIRPFSSGEDGFLARLSTNGALLWNTFLGGSGYDYATEVAHDGVGNFYIAGTSSGTWGSPVTPRAALDDAFVARVTASGILLWNTFLGGANDDGASGIATTGSGYVYVAGGSDASWGSPLRPYTANSDAFVAMLNPYGSLIWGTFLGGSGDDRGRGIALDKLGCVWITGRSGATWGAPTRAYTASTDAFVAKLDSFGTLYWNTFLGGTGSDSGHCIAVDGTGSAAYVVGESSATWGAPVRPYTPSPREAFAAKLDAGGSLGWNTFLGGSDYDEGRAIASDAGGNLWVCGGSEATWGSPVQPFIGEKDAFVAKLAVSAGGPTIKKVTSKRATRGSPATITGTGFSTNKTDNVVYFGGKKADIKRARAKRLNVNIPSKCKKGSVDVYVEVKGVKSNVVKFTVK